MAGENKRCPSCMGKLHYDEKRNCLDCAECHPKGALTLAEKFRDGEESKPQDITIPLIREIVRQELIAFTAPKEPELEKPVSESIPADEIKNAESVVDPGEEVEGIKIPPNKKIL